MREIHEHEQNDCNRQIRIIADDVNPDNGNASHEYALDLISGAPNSGGWTVRLPFQNGPIGEVGVNGITNEALLAIVADRLECFQTSKWSNPHNAVALEAVHGALQALKARTAEREARGVEGTHSV